ncbi:LCP family protein [Tissierella sp. MB52-C2]|uniref:LCP family protein n=1 Tax=Tissierella sp. MB52-C2 TaxID=3070999 RepID=UPI00280A646F|nr:LCP family protein [Tissierella sp. MB52-C2]WMM25122.1 LCP family protein [Tissierella sp. MB52-C2]
MKKKFILSFIISFACFALVFGFFGEKIFLRDNKTVATGEDGEIDNPTEESVIEQKNKDEILFLLMGVDAKDVKKSKGTRTDTMMLFKVDLETGGIKLLSIPRDTRVMVRDKEDKINHAHAFGGPELTMQTVRDFLNLDIDYYVKVDYKAVMGIVDAIGGVEIDVPRNMKYYDPVSDPPLNINLKKGLQVLDGKKSHDFLRYRSGYAEGDIGRIKAQQMFMKELIKQTIKPKNILKLPKLINTYFEYVDTNIPLNVILKGANVARKIDMENMETNTIPGYDKKISKIDYWIYDREQTEEIVKNMFGDYLLDQ